MLKVERLEDITLRQVEAAAAELARYIVRTPLKPWLDAEGASSDLTLKLESLQLGGSFKIRGALLNAMAALDKPGVRGLSAVSAGNHAIAVALAAKILRTSATVVLPADATNEYRIALCRSLGAEVVLASDRAAAFPLAQELTAERSLVFVPPFDSLLTMLGTATLGLEIVEAFGPKAPIIFAGVGGGGLVGGLALAAALTGGGARVVGVEPQTAATMTRSLAAGRALQDDSVRSVADGLTPPFVGGLCFEVCRRNFTTMVTVDDAAIVAATKDLVKGQRLLVEPSGACGVAGARIYPGDDGAPRVAVVSGGNISLGSLYALIGD